MSAGSFDRTTLEGWEPKPGEIVAVLTSDDRWLRKVVIGEGGHDFPCWNVAWEDAPSNEWVPWPMGDVEPIEAHPDALTREAFYAQ